MTVLPFYLGGVGLMIIYLSPYSHCLVNDVPSYNSVNITAFRMPLVTSILPRLPFSPSNPSLHTAIVLPAQLLRLL